MYLFIYLIAHKSDICISPDSLGGNSKTVIVANIGPANYNYEETLSTLRFASRAKRIKNAPMVNQDIKDAMLLEYHQEIQRLRVIALLHLI